jgi:hypothetical protein
MTQTSRIDARIRSLALASDCAQLGARVRTIQHLSGVHPSEIVRLLFSKRHPPPCGRPPDTREWYHRTSLSERIEASVIAVNFMRQRIRGFAGAESLVDAYRCYRTLFGARYHISFDRAFDLASHTAGLWIARAQCFHIASCARCGCDFLDALGASRSCDRNCPFCAQLQRHSRPRSLLAVAPAPRQQAGVGGN